MSKQLDNQDNNYKAYDVAIMALFHDRVAFRCSGEVTFQLLLLLYSSTCK